MILFETKSPGKLLIDNRKQLYIEWKNVSPRSRWVSGYMIFIISNVPTTSKFVGRSSTSISRVSKVLSVHSVTAVLYQIENW
jgi:hypothetical protein